MDNFQASIAIFSDFGYNMGIPIHFLPFSDESGQTFVLLMKTSQFFQETCKTKLYENSKKILRKPPGVNRHNQNRVKKSRVPS